MAHRPTPREGWTVPAEFREEPSAAGSPVLKPGPTSAEATLSFAELKPMPPVKPRREDETVSLVETPASVHVAQASTSGSRVEPRASTSGSRVEPRASTSGSRMEPRASTPMLATGLPSPAKRASQTLFGLPAPVLAKSGLAAPLTKTQEPAAEARAVASEPTAEARAVASEPAAEARAVADEPAVEAHAVADEPAFEAAASLSEASPLPQLQLKVEDARVNSRPPSALRRSRPWLHLVWVLPVALGSVFLWTRMSPEASGPSPLAKEPAAPEAPALALGAAAPMERALEPGEALGAAQALATGAEQGTMPVAAQDAGLVAEPADALDESKTEPGLVEPGAQAGAAADEPAGASAEGDDAEIEELDASRTAIAARADKLIDEAHALRKKGKLGPARVKYRAALTAYPGYPRATAGLLQLALQTRDGKQAVNLAKQLVQQRPNQLSYQVLLGDAYKVAGKRSLARETWQAAARKGSATARARLAK